MGISLKKVSHLKGFTLIELIVSLSVMMMMTGILLSRYPESIRKLTLSNQARNVELLIREAQVRGSAIDSSSGVVGGYGVYFSLTTPDKVALFADSISTLSPYQIMVGDGLYQSAPTDEARDITTLPKGYVVSRLCVWNGTIFDCSLAGTSGSLTVSFTRPSPQPGIYVNNSGSSYSAGCIELHSPEAPAAGHIRSVQVFNSGMLRMATSTCN